MALLYRADLVPSKLEMINAWLPTRAWFQGAAGSEITRVAACRLDDPAGQVGVEIILVRAADGPIHHTPLTYRGAPLPGAEEFLLGTTEHSVLGTRWVYDAPGDPVYAQVVADAIIREGTEAEEYVEGADGRQERRRPAMTMRGSGVADAPDSLRLETVRLLDPEFTVAGANLTAVWPDDGRPYILAYLT